MNRHRLQLPTRTIRYADVNPSNIIVNDYVDSKYSPTQKVVYLTYNGEPFQIQSPEIRLVAYGIPSDNPQFVKTEKDRMFIKIPEDLNNNKCVDFFKKFEEIEKVFDSDEFRTAKFGKGAKNYKFNKLVKAPQVQEADADDDSVKPNKPRSIKIKIDCDYATNKVLTKCFIKQGDGQMKPVEDIETIDDLAKYVRYNSVVKFLVVFQKSYAMKSKLANADHKLYGLTLKVSQIVCEEKQSVSVIPNDCVIDVSDDD